MASAAVSPLPVALDRIALHLEAARARRSGLPSSVATCVVASAVLAAEREAAEDCVGLTSNARNTSRNAARRAALDRIRQRKESRTPPEEFVQVLPSAQLAGAAGFDTRLARRFLVHGPTAANTAAAGPAQDARLPARELPESSRRLVASGGGEPVPWEWPAREAAAARFPSLHEEIERQLRLSEEFAVQLDLADELDRTCRAVPPQPPVPPAMAPTGVVPPSAAAAGAPLAPRFAGTGGASAPRLPQRTVPDRLADCGTAGGHSATTELAVAATPPVPSASEVTSSCLAQRLQDRRTAQAAPRGAAPPGEWPPPPELGSPVSDGSWPPHLLATPAAPCVPADNVQHHLPPQLLADSTDVSEHSFSDAAAEVLSAAASIVPVAAEAGAPQVLPILSVAGAGELSGWMPAAGARPQPPQPPQPSQISCPDQEELALAALHRRQAARFGCRSQARPADAPPAALVEAFESSCPVLGDGYWAPASVPHGTLEDSCLLRGDSCWAPAALAERQDAVVAPEEVPLAGLTWPAACLASAQGEAARRGPACPAEAQEDSCTAAFQGDELRGDLANFAASSRLQLDEPRNAVTVLERELLARDVCDEAAEAAGLAAALGRPSPSRPMTRRGERCCLGRDAGRACDVGEAFGSLDFEPDADVGFAGFSNGSLGGLQALLLFDDEDDSADMDIAFYGQVREHELEELSLASRDLYAIAEEESWRSHSSCSLLDLDADAGSAVQSPSPGGLDRGCSTPPLCTSTAADGPSCRSDVLDGGVVFWDGGGCHMLPPAPDFRVGSPPLSTVSTTAPTLDSTCELIPGFCEVGTPPLATSPPPLHLAARPPVSCCVLAGHVSVEEFKEQLAFRSAEAVGAPPKVRRPAAPAVREEDAAARAARAAAAALRLQALARGFLVRRRRLLRAALRIQAASRGFAARRAVRSMRAPRTAEAVRSAAVHDAATRLAAVRARRRAEEERSAAVRIQAQWRGHAVRRACGDERQRPRARTAQEVGQWQPPGSPSVPASEWAWHGRAASAPVSAGAAARARRGSGGGGAVRPPDLPRPAAVGRSVGSRDACARAMAGERPKPPPGRPAATSLRRPCVGELLKQLDAPAAAAGAVVAAATAVLPPLRPPAAAAATRRCSPRQRLATAQRPPPAAVAAGHQGPGSAGRLPQVSSRC